MRFDKVRDCYSVLSISLLAGVEDYTEGIYGGVRATPYAEAQRRQHDRLLDQLGVGAGFRLLDVGCGTGSLLRRAKDRGAVATGITISREQVEIGRGRGLDVRLLDYREIGRAFRGEFDGVVANGSIEHFCQPEDAAAGRQEEIYREMFGLFRDVLRPASVCRRVVTTTIHFRHAHVPPDELTRFPLVPWRGRAARNLAILFRGFGGFYPTPGQLARCAAPHFRLVAEEDGTEDYRFTSEDWRAKLLTALKGDRAFRRRLVRCFGWRPRATLFLLLSFVGPQAWLWQFRGEAPPMVHFRQTWSAG